MGAAAGGEDWGASGGETGVGVEVGSSSRHERRRARLSSNSLAVSDGVGAGMVGGELLREGEGDRIRCGGVCCRVVARIECKKSSMEVGVGGMMVLRLWRGIGGVGFEGARQGEDVVAVPAVVRQALEESVRICGGVGGGRSWRKFLMISWVGAIGLSSSGTHGGEVGLWSVKESLGLVTLGPTTVGGWEAGLVGDVEAGEGGVSPGSDGMEQEGEVVRELLGDGAFDFLLSTWARE